MEKEIVMYCLVDSDSGQITTKGENICTLISLQRIGEWIGRYDDKEDVWIPVIPVKR